MVHIDISDRFNKFLKRVNYAEATVKNYSYSVKRFSSWLEIPIDDVKAETIYQYLAYLHHKRLKPESINSSLHSIKRFYDYLYHEEKLKIPNPVKPNYRQKLPNPLPRFLSNREVTILFNSIKNKRDYAIFMLMLRCGLRVNEVANLTIPAVDFDNGTILIMKGKFCKDRVVFISQDAQYALLDYLNFRHRFKDTRIFLVQKGLFRGNPLSKRGIQKRIEYYARITGLTVSCHRLRHTMATQLLNADAMLATVQEILGHDSIYSTQRYAKISNTKVRRDYFKAIKKLQVL